MSKFVILGAGLLATLSVANAATVTLQWLGSGLNAGVTITDGSLGISEGTAAGQLRWHVTATTWPGVLAGSNIFTYCTDITQFVGDGPLTITDLPNAPLTNPASPPMGAYRASLLRKLYNTSYADANTSGLKSAAFQCAIWELVNEESITDGAGSRLAAGFDVASGDFHINPDASIYTKANAYIDSAYTDGTSGLGLVAGVSPVLQDQIFLAPLPTAAGLAGVGLLGVAARRRRA